MVTGRSIWEVSLNRNGWQRTEDDAPSSLGVQVKYDEYWEAELATYASIPTHRHRIRFVINCLRAAGVNEQDLVFDYGCGAGLFLVEIRQALGLADSQLGGCDLAGNGIKKARQSIESPHFFCADRPELDVACDYIVCSEVIEHTVEYRAILSWVFEHLAHGGSLILTTPTGPMSATDRFYGHVQHFEIDELTALLEELGFEIRHARRWGFPFFTLQKALTTRFFDHARKTYISGPLTLYKRLLFSAAHCAYFVHDLIPFGPQILIRAAKPSSGRP